MAQEITLEQALAALQRHYGGKGLEAGHDDGLDLMANAMRQELGIPKAQADKLVRQLDAAHLIRWVARGVAPATPESGVVELVPGAAEPQRGQVSADPGAHGFWRV